MTALNQLWDRIRRAVKRRPVRVVEALIALAGAIGISIQPEAATAILTLVGLTFASGEVAQTRTKPYDPKADPTNPRR